MGVLEQRIVESGEASVANATMVEMQQVQLFVAHYLRISTLLSEYQFEICLTMLFFLATDNHEIDGTVQ